jgi:hypothetical protein
LHYLRHPFFDELRQPPHGSNDNGVNLYDQDDYVDIEQVGQSLDRLNINTSEKNESLKNNASRKAKTVYSTHKQTDSSRMMIKSRGRSMAILQTSSPPLQNKLETLALSLSSTIPFKKRKNSHSNKENRNENTVPKSAFSFSRPSYKEETIVSPPEKQSTRKKRRV